MQVNTNQLILLVEKFLVDIKKAKRLSMGRLDVTKEYKIALMEDTASLLSSGLSYKKLAHVIENHKGIKGIKKTYSLTDILKESGVEIPDFTYDYNPNELIQLGRFYYNPLLQETSAKVEYVYKEESQCYERKKMEDFFLEIKTSFTMDDLTDHFLFKNKAEYPNRKGIQTQFRNMLPTYGLDLILYMIEAMTFPDITGEVSLPGTPRGLERPDIINEAKRLLAKRIGDFKEAKIYGIIPRPENRI